MSKWNHVSDVEEMVMNPRAYRELRGWRYYRLEYFTPDSDYSDREYGIWLPVTLNRDKFFNEINLAIKNLVQRFESDLLNEIAEWKKLRDSLEPPKFVSMEQRVENCNRKIAELEEDLAKFRDQYRRPIEISEERDE
jgi:hypothetical protein